MKPVYSQHWSYIQRCFLMVSVPSMVILLGFVIVDMLVDPWFVIFVPAWYLLLAKFWQYSYFFADRSQCQTSERYYQMQTFLHENWEMGRSWRWRHRLLWLFSFVGLTPFFRCRSHVLCQWKRGVMYGKQE